MVEVLIGLITGLVSGFVSGILVYIVTNNREKKYLAFRYMSDYLYRLMDNLEVEIPSEILRQSYVIGKNNDEWNKIIIELLDINRKYEPIDRVYSEEEERQAKLILEALELLNNWACNEHLIKRRK